MKIRVAYAENEQEKKRQHEAAVKRLFPDTKVKEIGLKDGFSLTIPPICGIIDIEQYRHEYRTLFVLGVSLEIKAWE